jgi:O-antigen ligase
LGESERETTAQRPAIVSSGDLLGSARTLRTLQHALELVVLVIVVGSVAAIGSVHAPAYTVLWVACFVAFALTLLRALAIGGLRQRLGAHRVAFHVSGRWLVVEPHEDDHALGWSIDLREPALPRGALLAPGMAFLALALLQLVPLAAFGGPVTLEPVATRRGITFLLALLTLHEAAAAVFAQRPAWRRFRRVLTWLGAALALVALAQLASGTSLVYWWFEPLEGGQPFGPFVNRNHFAGYMLLVLPIALGLLAAAWRAYARRAGGDPNARRRLVALASPEGTALVYAALAPLLGIGALVASTSRGGILAFVFALAIAVVGARSRRGMPGWVAALLFAGMVLSWFGLERLELRFVRAADDAPGRTVIWRESLAALHGPRWATGYGFNAFAEAISRVPAWQLPRGATPWPAPVDAPLRSGARLGYRAPGDLPGLDWYREAHNDWLQLLVETGVPGLLIGLWGALAALHAARRDPWRFAALAGVLMHAFVDFDLQIPAISALLVVLAADRDASPREGLIAELSSPRRAPPLIPEGAGVGSTS